MGELGALFNPGMRHELEERRSKAARREEEGNARDGDLRIDLESGVAVINSPGDDPDQPGEAQPGEAQPAGDLGADPTTAARLTAPEESAPSVRHTPEAEHAAADDKPAPAPALKPRGKRGMSSAPR